MLRASKMLFTRCFFGRRLVDSSWYNHDPLVREILTRSPLGPLSGLERQPHGHQSQSIVQLSLGADRPPVVEKDLERSPHRHPAADHQRLSNQGADGQLAELTIDKARDSYRDREKGYADEEAGATDPKKLAQPTRRAQRTLPEKLVDRRADCGCIVLWRRCIDVDLQRQLRVTLRRSRPRDDELLDLGFEIPLTRRRRIDWIEELPEIRDADLDQLRIRRNLVANPQLVGHVSAQAIHDDPIGERRQIHVTVGDRRSGELGVTATRVARIELIVPELLADIVSLECPEYPRAHRVLGVAGVCVRRPENAGSVLR